MHRPDTEIVNGVQRQRLGEFTSHGQEPINDPIRMAHVGQRHDLVSDLTHCRTRLEIALSVRAIEMACIQWHQSAGSIKHIDHGSVRQFGVPHRISEYGWQPLLAGETEHASG